MDHDRQSTLLHLKQHTNSDLDSADASEEHLQSISHHHLSDRNASPSRNSIFSTSSFVTTSTVPHLKRKNGYKHMRDDSTSNPPALSTLTPVASFPKHQDTLNQPLLSRIAQVHLVRSNTAPSPKRPPASHSSYGVETIAGPPPSFDTRKTISQEGVWKVDRSKSLRIISSAQKTETEGQVPLAGAGGLIETKQTNPATPLLSHSSPETADTLSIATPIDGEEVSIMDVRNDQGLGVGNSETGSKASSESHKSEDLFLNIAKTDAERPSSSKAERRRSKVYLGFMSGARPATSHNPETATFQTDPSAGTPRAELSSFYNKRSSLQFGQTRANETEMNLDSIEVANSGHFNKKPSLLYADTIRPPQRAGTSMRPHRLVSDSVYLDRPKTSEHVTTESTASTAAPSTVWDELDDLKSRIKKLELTGKLPPSSAAAMSSAERPRTATTAATTMSGSPKHNKTATPRQSAIEGIPSTVHPLLHEALDNAKVVVSHEVYQKLQTTAQDALQLASLTSFDGSSVRGGTQGMSERMIRRRTESMCRSLTELAIALAAETKPIQSVPPPAGRDYYSPSAALRNRRYSQNNEPTDRPPVSTRVQSRLESRRVSTQPGYTSARHTSPDLESPTALPAYPGTNNRITRPSGQFRSRRAQEFLDGANEDEEASIGPRPISRAMTDIASTQRQSRDPAVTSREYTSQHPMPSNANLSTASRTPLPSNLSTNFISRRKYPSPANVSTATDSSPLASRQSWGRISIVQKDHPPPSDTVSEAPESSRSVSTRRSLGFASRLGTSVGNRLRAARTERIESRTYKDSPMPDSAMPEPIALQETPSREQ